MMCIVISSTPQQDYYMVGKCLLEVPNTLFQCKFIQVLTVYSGYLQCNDDWSTLKDEKCMPFLACSVLEILPNSQTDHQFNLVLSFGHVLQTGSSLSLNCFTAEWQERMSCLLVNQLSVHCCCHIHRVFCSPMEFVCASIKTIWKN